MALLVLIVIPQLFTDIKYRMFNHSCLQVEMSVLLSDLLHLEHKIDCIRSSNKFPPHTSAASGMYDRRLLDDEAWLSTYTVPVVVSAMSMFFFSALLL